MKKEKIKDFDERQVQVRCKIYTLGFNLLFFALCLNALIPIVFGITWADGGTQGILLAFSAVTAVHVTLSIHGLVYGRKSKITTIATFFAVGFVFIPYLLIRINETGQSFIEDGMLSNMGFGVVLMVLLAINIACPIIQLIRDKKANKEEKA
ncbi:MAG: hypothetical protein FWE60_04115 [Oscillospiraceae bacterium]|nr:hypothetical protein [Oscillospiraceae bacterium]